MPASTTLTIDILSNRTSFNLKGITQIIFNEYGYLGGTPLEALISSVRAEGNNMFVNLFYSEYGYTFTGTLKFTNCNNLSNIEFVYYGTHPAGWLSNLILSKIDYPITEPNKVNSVVGSFLDDIVDLAGYYVYDQNGDEINEGHPDYPKIKGITISGGLGADTITGSIYKDTIKGDAGHDYINGYHGDDTITGGLGTNTIVFEEGFGVDTINLTKNENCILDLTYFGLNEDDLIQMIKINSANVEIHVTETDIIKLNKLASSNPVGPNGSVSVLLNGGDEPINLNAISMGEYTNADFNSKGAFVGTRFAETITAENLGMAVNINAKDGYNVINVTDDTAHNDTITAGNDGNEIYIMKSGDKKITTGAGNDMIDLQGAGTHNINAGNGENMISVIGDGNITVNSGNNGDGINVDGVGTHTINAGNGENMISVIGDGNTTVNSGNNGDGINVDGVGTHTINAGNGENMIMVMGDGITTVKCGADSDIIGIDNNSKQVTINAGDGDNTIDIFGQVSGNVNITTGKGDDTITSEGTGNAKINTNAGHDSIISGSGNDTITAGIGNDTITGGAGNDLITGGTGNDTFIFMNNHGVDIITDADNNDVLRITNVDAANLRYARNGNDFEIYYSDAYDQNNKIVLQKYFKKTPAQQQIKLFAQDSTEENYVNLADVGYRITGKGTINGTAGNDDIFGSDFKDTIKAISGLDTITANGENDNIYCGTTAESRATLIFNAGDGIDTVFSGKGNDTLQFTNMANGEALENLSYNVVGKDLKIFYTENDCVIIKNYYDTKTDSSIKTLEALNGDTINLAQYAPSANGAKKYIINTDDNLAVGNTNSEIVFTGNFGDNTISSNGGNYTDRLIFKDYSLTDDTMYVGYNYDYNELTMEQIIGDSLRIALYDNDNYMGPWGDKTVDYQNYFTTDTHNIVIEDKNKTYHLSKFNNVMTNLNLSSGTYAKQNNIVFLHGESETAVNKVTSNKGYNFINSYGAALNYTFKGGVDDVNSESENTDDIYNINVFNNKTHIHLTDGGGNDIINFNTKSDNLRLFFWAWDDGESGLSFESDEINILHKDFDFMNAVYANNGDIENCGIDIEGYSDDYMIGAAGIETYTTTDYKNGLNMQAWINVIKSNVVEWNTAHPGALEAIYNEEVVAPETLNSLIACYDISYDQAMAQLNQA